jgi:DNA-binding HxlR family transcriptional regulator
MDPLEERILELLTQGPMEFDSILAKVDTTPQELDEALHSLRNAGYVTDTLTEGWKLA